jgi:hypothetical protein
MRTWIKRSFYLTVLLLLLIQLFPLARTNPPVDPARTIHASMTIDPHVSSTLARACNDCHSNLTVWPWYSRVAPASWLVVSDVKRGRKALNFSDWKSISEKEQAEILPKICKEVAEREMPPEEYALMHWGKAPAHDEVEAICSWAHSTGLPGSERATKE